MESATVVEDTKIDAGDANPKINKPTKLADNSQDSKLLNELTKNNASLNEILNQQAETKETEMEESNDPETKEEVKCEASDSESEDGQSEEDRQKEMEERKKLHQETEQHKMKMLKIIIGLIAIEMITCSILMSTPFGVKNDPNNYFTSRMTNFRNDTIDIVFASIFRLIILYAFIQIIIVWGNVKTYDPEIEKHTIFNTKASHYKLVTKIKAYGAYIVLEIWKRIIGLNQYASFNNNGFTSLLLQQNDQQTDNMITDKKLKKKKLFDLAEFVNKYEGMDAQDVADVWKTVIWMLLFFAMTVCTTIIGIKISFFQIIENSGDNGYEYYYYIGLFGTIITLTHTQTFFVKKYIDDCCKPENRYFDAAVHPHPMFKTKNRGRYCQLCWKRPGQHSTERKLIFKCLQCPPHRGFVCIKCWNKKRKEAKCREKEKKQKEELDVGIDVNDREITFGEYFTKLLKYHLPYMHLLLLGVIAMGICSVINIFLPKQKGQLLDRLISGDMNGFYLAIKMQIFLTVLQGIINSISSQSMNIVSQQITCDLQKKMFSNLMAQDMVFFDNHTTTEINERMNWGLSEMLSPFQSTIRTVLKSFVSLFGSLYMCLNISWRLTFLGVSTLGPMSYFMNLFSRWNWQRNIIQRELQREMYAISYQGFEHIRAVRAFAKEHEFVRYYSMLRQQSHDTDQKKRVTQSINGIINSWFRLGTKLLLTWIAGMIILNNSNDTNKLLKTNLTVGLFITFETYWQRLYHTIQSIRGTYSTYDRAFFTAKKIFRTLEKKTEIEHLAMNNKKEELVNNVDGNIKFENVEFYYESSANKLVLKSINLEIEKGKTTALVGRSGGGKSTIMHLMLRFYDPTKGKITINNINLKKYNPYSLRRQIALVSQDTELFTKSVEYNIGFGANKRINEKNTYESAFTLNQIEYSAKLANAHKFICEMEDKYDTQMGSRAKRCSGGQKQRISIARMLMSKPKVMLLDEATSSLDAESEALVQAAMERESEEKNCTLVIVAHRLSTVVNADKICVVDDGNIVEQGTHEELIDLKGIYASLVERQINLRTKMKRKLENMKKQNGTIKDDVGDDDFDNIDKLIDQIKADKLKKQTEKKSQQIEEINA